MIRNFDNGVYYIPTISTRYYLIPILNEVDSPGLWIGRTAGLRSIAALILILQIEAKFIITSYGDLLLVPLQAPKIHL